MPHATDYGVTSVQEVVEHVFEIEGEVIGDEYHMVCPDPAHADTSPSCSVNLTSGYWHCFSCGVGGDLASLGSLSMAVDKEEAARLLRPTSPEAVLTSVKHKLSRLEIHNHMKRSKPLPGPYQYGPFTELYERGFKDETLRRWGVRFAVEQELEGKKGPFTIRDSIAIPIRDSRGHLLSWCYRTTRNSPGWQPRYLYTPGIDIKDLWFGQQHHASAHEITIVEGALDAMWCDQAGVPALALLGSQMAERKLLELQRYSRVTILADRDTSGVRSVQRIGQTLGTRMPIFVASYPSWIDSGDPQELLPVDIEIMVHRARPWLRWLERVRSA